MVRTLTPREAETLTAAGGVDVVDVREHDEWLAGHIPGARLVPLAELRADPRAHVRGDRVLFVCARGSRSLTAAKHAEQAGVPEIYSLDGGTKAWESAGLPVTTPPPPTRAAAPQPAEPTEPAGEACGLPAPSLDAVVGANLRELRTRRNMTLDALARHTGLGRQLLGQIENGRASPSVSVVWKIAQAFDVPFSALLSTPERPHTSVLRGATARRLVSPDGRFSSRALVPPSEDVPAEFYELFFAAHSREDAGAHRAGTRENLVVTAGRLEIEVAGERFELAEGDAITFVADTPHSYINRGHEDCWAYLVMTYAARG